MKKCTCSATNPDDANFCRICGKKFGDNRQGLTEKPNRSFPEPANKPAKIVRGIKFVLIKGGTFMMGSPESEPERGANEKQHEETVSDFYMSEKTITNEQYCVFLNENDVYGNGEMDVKDFGKRQIAFSNNFAGLNGLEYKNSRWHTRPEMENLPVVCMSLFGAIAYCEWLGGRLPAEAEWEYACRAGTRTAFNTGRNLTTSQANYNGNYPYDGNEPGVYLERMQPVGSYPPNAWGLYDMHGNVYEWCRDEIKHQHYSLRGGGFLHFATECRSAHRVIRNPCNGYNFGYGFRAVLPVV
jgi:formylglycine-generating enzyme required for sulfatase activity